MAGIKQDQTKQKNPSVMIFHLTEISSLFYNKLGFYFSTIVVNFSLGY